MQVEFAFLADAAQESNGKLYVIGGGIDRLGGPSFPLRHLMMSLVVKLRLEAIECQREHSLQIVLWDPDGNPIGGKLDAKFQAERNADEPTNPVFVQLVLNLVGIEFPHPGDYAFHIVVNGQEARRLNLFVRAVGNPILPGPAN